ncbi:MAG: hypothetical protein PHE19_03920 [Candidatus Cloacimonetes bacterium]|nr:hypothetical protein [Candidatus Cloacimonadota bacterium]
MKNIFINIVNAMCILRRETFVFDLNEFYNKLILASLQYNTIQYNTIQYNTILYGYASYKQNINIGCYNKFT